LKTTKQIRLPEEVVFYIKELGKEIFGKDAEVWIFGSRANPEAKGGDIDIYIETESTKDIFRKKIKFLVKLENKIGEQKIDLIVKKKGCQEYICQEAKKTGIKL